jgi:hypothetical protein
VTAGDRFEALLASYPSQVRALARAARAFIRRRLPAAEEYVDAPARIVGYGYGAGYKGLICTLILSKTGVKLGLVGGAALPDPGRLLEGTGKSHRHVPLKAASDLRRPGLEKLVQTAFDAWRERGRRAHAERPRAR